MPLQTIEVLGSSLDTCTRGSTVALAIFRRKNDLAEIGRGAGGAGTGSDAELIDNGRGTQPLRFHCAHPRCVYRDLPALPGIDAVRRPRRDAGYVTLPKRAFLGKGPRPTRDPSRV